MQNAEILGKQQRSYGGQNKKCVDVDRTTSVFNSQLFSVKGERGRKGEKGRGKEREEGRVMASGWEVVWTPLTLRLRIDLTSY